MVYPNPIFGCLKSARGTAGGAAAVGPVGSNRWCVSSLPFKVRTLRLQSKRRDERCYLADDPLYPPQSFLWDTLGGFSIR
jgi:hypothetical protein